MTTEEKVDYKKNASQFFFRPDHKEERAIVKYADANIYVIGSGFMEGRKNRNLEQIGRMALL